MPKAMAEDPKSYDKDEVRQRMEAALRGARIVGPVPKSSMTPKRPKPQRKAGEKPKPRPLKRG